MKTLELIEDFNHVVGTFDLTKVIDLAVNRDLDAKSNTILSIVEKSLSSEGVASPTATAKYRESKRECLNRQFAEQLKNKDNFRDDDGLEVVFHCVELCYQLREAFMKEAKLPRGNE